MLLDLLIVVVLGIAIFVGFQRGLLPPLFAELGFIAGLLLFLRGPLASLPRLVTHITAVHVAVAVVLALVVGFLGGRAGRLLQRMPVIRGVDGFLGIFVHAGVALVVLYILISALAAMDSAFQPLMKQATLTAAQADQLQRTLLANPVTSALVSRQETSQLRHDSRSKQGALIDNFPQLNQIQNIYLNFVRPQLHGSRLAPIVLRLGSKLPVVHHLGTSAIPKTR